MQNEFLDFLKEYGVIGLAAGVVIGTAVKDFVNAMVEDAIMPVIGVILSREGWRAATASLGPVTFNIGHLIGAFLDLIIIAFLVFVFLKYIMKKEKVEKV